MFLMCIVGSDLQRGGMGHRMEQPRETSVTTAEIKRCQVANHCTGVVLAFVQWEKHMLFVV